MKSKPAPTDPAQGCDSAIGNCSLFISDESDESATIDIVGEVDLSSAPRVYEMMWRTSLNGRRTLVLNMEDLDFMDSSGLQALLRLREKLRSRGQTVFLVNVKPQIEKLFKLTGFDRLFSSLPE